MQRFRTEEIMGANMDEWAPGLQGVSVRRATPAESKAHLASLVAKAWPDNKQFAAGVRKQIKEEVSKQIPLVQAAVAAAHEKFELHKVIEALQVPNHTSDAYRLFQRCRCEYESWQLNRDFVGPRDVGGIAHASWSVLDGMSEHLTERGFRRNGLGWSDGAGVTIRGESWVDLKIVGKERRWIDPAGILAIRSRYDALFRSLLVVAESSQSAPGIDS